MPHLQIDGVNIAEVDALAAETLKRQASNATRTWLHRISIEERSSIPDPRSEETIWERGEITIVVRYETKLTSD